MKLNFKFNGWTFGVVLQFEFIKLGVLMVALILNSLNFSIVGQINNNVRRLY